MTLSINQLSELTGKDRRTITARLKDVHYETEGARTHFYDSREALEQIYLMAGKTLDEATKEQALSAATLNRARNEVERRRRIPIDISLRATDQAIQAITALLKAACGKTLTAEMINEFLEGFREIPALTPGRAVKFRPARS